MNDVTPLMLARAAAPLRLLYWATRPEPRSWSVTTLEASIASPCVGSSMRPGRPGVLAGIGPASAGPASQAAPRAAARATSGRGRRAVIALAPCEQQFG